MNKIEKQKYSYKNRIRLDITTFLSFGLYSNRQLPHSKYKSGGWFNVKGILGISPLAFCITCASLKIRLIIKKIV